jgi:lysozyme
MPTPNDVPTIGYGTTKGVKMGDTITPDRALKRLADELDTVYVAAVKRCVKVPLFDYEFGAYVSFTYNVGVGAFCGSALVEKLNGGDYAGACAEISRWNKQKGKVLGGLTTRRAEERAVCEGKYAEP